MRIPISNRRSINGWAIAAVLWLVGLCVVALYWGLFVLAPLDKTEALQIGVAESMQRLATVWLLVGLALFSTIATKLPGYILPVIPAAVVLMALSHPYPRWCLRVCGKTA